MTAQSGAREPRVFDPDDPKGYLAGLQIKRIA